MICKPQYCRRKQNKPSSSTDGNFKYLINGTEKKINYLQITFHIIIIAEMLHVHIAFWILWEIDIKQQDLDHFSDRITILK